jgi:hypothetical protein
MGAVQKPVGTFEKHRRSIRVLYLVRRLDTRAGERVQSIRIGHVSGSKPRPEQWNREAAKKFPDFLASGQKPEVTTAAYLLDWRAP